MTTIVRLRESDRARPVRLTGEQARRLAAAGVVEVRPGAGAGTWLLRSDRTVGAARIGDVELYVEPKLPVGNLLFLLGYARDPKGWRKHRVPATDADGLMPALADALWRQIDQAIRPGLPQGYRTTEATSTVLRGRIRETRQLGRWPGRPVPLEIRYDEFTADIPENRILAGAVERMLRVPGIRPESRRMLRHLSAVFAEVSPLWPGQPTPAWIPTRTNTRLWPALRLAELVLSGRSIDVRTGHVAVNGLLIDLATLFEEFVTASLRAALQSRFGGLLIAQANGHLDHGRRIAVRPDLVWKKNGRVIAVADAKYKRHTPTADMYQMLAYCTAYGLPRGHLVYAAGGTPSRHVVRNAGTEIVCHFLDLGRAPADLLTEVNRLAEEIARTETTMASSIR
ncbi:McrC family protein [Plantactinospora sonchi]|uniref:Restriction endonuclease n=1 Tax=Plantactinospora sonchi TaxID=1544735 RepID=A0ABU7RXC4_9ACTN